MVPAAADDAAPAQMVYLVVVDELVLHKNGQPRNNICTLYAIIVHKNYQNWLMSVEDIAKAVTVHGMPEKT